jgi:subtilisin family serine protease
MPSVLRCIQITAAACSLTSGARLARKPETSAKFIAGVPVLNWDHIVQESSMAKTSAEASDQVMEWVVVLKPWVSTKIIARFCKQQADGLGLCKAMGNPSDGGFAFLTMKTSEKFMDKAMSLLKWVGGNVVKYIEVDTQVKMIPDMQAEATSTPWGLTHVGVPSSSAKGQGVNVYVLDTGIRVTHADFGGRASSAIDMAVNDGNLTECLNSTDCAKDNQGHGTHCAGTVGGDTFGVAPKARLFAGKVLGDSGSGSWSWSYLALDYCASKATRPTVASMSLGGASRIQAMKDAVEAAVDAGVVVVVAGGNENSDACNFSPAFIPKAITVGSITSNNKRSYFSNFGSCVDFWAPGSDITSASHDSDTRNTTMSGTSMACPHVSGGAALILGSSPQLSSTDVMATFMGKAINNAIRDLKFDDTNALLWVGDDAAPPFPEVPTPEPPAPTPAPAACPGFSVGPDADGDCKCLLGKSCSRDGGYSENCPTSGGVGAFNGIYFLPTCADCMCW